jgi:hypothetical protein
MRTALVLWIVVNDGWLTHIVAASSFLDVVHLLHDDRRLPPGDLAIRIGQPQYEKFFRLVQEHCGTRGAETLSDYAHLIAAEMGGPSTFVLCSFQGKKIRHVFENYDEGSP